MPDDEKNPFVQYLENRDELSAEEKRVLEQGFQRERCVPAGQDILREGDTPTESCLILSGVAGRYNMFSGGRRTILAVHIKGDFIDLHGFILKSLDHGVVALSDVTIAMVHHDYLRHITQAQPHLTRLLWLSTVVDAAMHRRWLAVSGRLSAAARMAHLLSEMRLRMMSAGLCGGSEIDLPLTQAQLADLLGMSLVHINRTIQQLRQSRMIEWRGRRVSFLNVAKLEAFGEFSADYLNLRRLPDGKPMQAAVNSA